MIQQMIQNMLGDYAKYVTPLGNGEVELNMPKDLNNPSLEGATKIHLNSEELLKLMSICFQLKQYEIDGNTISEGDDDFKLNKWADLAIKSVKNK